MFQIHLGNKDYGKYSDEDLLALTKQGEKQAFEVLYDRWNKKIYNYLLTILNYNIEDATNILSEIFIKIYEYNKTKSVEKFKSFVYRIARNKAIDLIKTNRGETQSQFNDEYMFNIEDQKDIKQKQKLSTEYKQNLLQNFINQLEQIQREVLHLYFFENHSYEEIANIIGSNKNSVGTVVFKAKKNLKSMIDRAGLKDILLMQD